MGSYFQILALLLLSLPCIFSQVTEFTSIDCGGDSNYTDKKTGLAWISDNGIMNHGKTVDIQNLNDEWEPYKKRRDFPTDDRKYCYTLDTKERRRYLVRATFLYGSTETADTYPSFLLYLDATKWATVTVFDGSRTYVKEMIIRAPSSSIDVCLCCATTGSPFISTLELRPLNLSMYATDYEDNFYMKVAARVNFGAPTKDPIRYPDDPFDRVWESDQVKRPNFLVGVAPGTERIDTTKNIEVNNREYPPVKVMQTAVVGTEGYLTYRLTLEDFPGNARAFAYFAEIENLRSNETRKFRMEHPYVPDYSNAVVNIAENANGTYKLYEPSYMNVTLDFVLSFSFVKTPDSTEGPLLSAIEISKYVQIGSKADAQDVIALNAILATLPADPGKQDKGDPCTPTRWEWVLCSSTAPRRITAIHLSQRNLTGVIPPEIQNMDALTELWLDGNSFTGPIPDISNLLNLKIVHLENNRLNGFLPSYLSSLPSLQELYIQNNYFSGKIPPALLSRKIVFNYNGNPGLTKGMRLGTKVKLVVGISVAALVAFIILVIWLSLRKFRRKASQQNSYKVGGSLHAVTKPQNGHNLTRGAHLMDDGVACCIKLSEIEAATMKFTKNIGRGSFGVVYYGRMKDGKEVAVKIIGDPTSQGTKQFLTEVSLLSRIHHRNLVPLIGYCEEANHRILVYEYMHNGTLRDHIHDSIKQRQLDWLTRLRIAEDAAKGLEYLHTGCSPSIIHRDVKTSNILLDINMRAKVADFGLSRQAEEDLTHISSVAKGTVGYLDPEYYACQQLTEKSDVYSFGIVLLELISGRKPITEDYGTDWNIVHWARSLIRKGDVGSMIDPLLADSVKLESAWRVAEVAIQCVEQHGTSRPKMQEIIMAVQDAVMLEKGAENNQNISSGSGRAQSSRKTLLTSFLEIESPDLSNARLTPSAR
ncbi:probable LRR receptor-like serine/threonine-protein kinase At1g67720 isoform X1 [Chenopodium quinoa]|uniref:probable LRR receptor-like serine/threonine-protein kinase At1g67720 isoform X1 n=1 Tax=Chenopodium quinoa TaxID=63459 RepID=UPI000B7727EE|nr:probable LRR receptor-like serine/threonine-protein kinase At1g67720 isoform X1 [Chenopodium quinoa]